MFKVFAVAAGAALLAFAPGAASAQEDTYADGALCVYDALMVDTDYEIVAEFYLFGGTPDETKEAGDLLDQIAKTCSDKYKLSEDELSAATDMGVYGGTVDYLSEELTFAGVDEAVISKLFELYDERSSDNADQFLSADWRDDSDFIASINKSIADTGLPQGQYEVARELIAAQILSDDAMMTYLSVTPDDEP